MNGSEMTDNLNQTEAQTTRARIASFLQQNGALIMLIIVCIAGFIRYEAFLTPENRT